MTAIAAQQETVIRESIDQFLTNYPLFGALQAGDLALLVRYLDQRSVRTGEVLFKQGQEGPYACFIMNGRISIERRNSSLSRSARAMQCYRVTQTYRVSLGRGESFGELSLLDEQPRSASATVDAGGDLIILTRSSFQTLISDHPQIATRLLLGMGRLLSHKLRETTSHAATHNEQLCNDLNDSMAKLYT